MKKIYLSLIITAFIFSGLQAQTDSAEDEDVSTNHGFKEISLVTGYYNPGLDYYINSTGYQFTGSLFFSFYGEYWMPKYPVTMRLGVGYYSTTAKIEGDLNWKEELSLNYLPITVDVLWHFNSIYTYIGFGMGVNIINVSYKGPETNQDPSGHSSQFQGIAGFEYPLSTNFSIGAEFQYVMGSYNQEFQSGTTISEQSININGAKIGLKLSYLF